MDAARDLHQSWYFSSALNGLSRLAYRFHEATMTGVTAISEPVRKRSMEKIDQSEP